MAAAVRNFYTDFSNVKYDDRNLEKALKLAKRCHEKYLSIDSWRRRTLKKKTSWKWEKKKSKGTKDKRGCVSIVHERKGKPERVSPDEIVLF